MGMEDKSDSSESAPESLVQVTVGCNRKSSKRTADSEKEFASIQRRKLPRQSDDSSDDEATKQLSRINPPSISQMLPGEDKRSFQNPTSAVSDILPNFPENPQQDECESKRSPSCEELLSSNVLSENLSKKLCLHEDPTVIETSESNPSNDLISFRNLEQSLNAIHNNDNFLQDQSDSLENSDVISRKKSSFKPSFIFRNLLHTPNNKEVEELSCERRIFQSHFPEDVLSEDEHIFRDIKNIFESEGKLKNSIEQTKSWIVHQTLSEDVFQNLSGQGSQDCCDWDKFLERWEGVHVIPGSTSSAHPDLKTGEEPNNVCLQDSLKSKGRKRKKKNSNSSPSVPFNGEIKKRPCIAGSPETSSSLKSSSSDEEYSSNQKSVLPSFENEMEMIVHPVSSNITETNTSSKLEKFLKNTKIKLLEDDPIPPFIEKFISLDPESLPSRTIDSYEIHHVDPKDIINLLTMSSDSNSSDKVEELTGLDGGPSVFEDDDARMIS